MFPAVISKLLLGYAWCQLKSWLSQMCLTCREMPDYKAFTARGKSPPALWYGWSWQNLFLPQNGENSSVTQVGTWSPMQCIPNTSHPCYNSLWPPSSELLPGRLGWGHCTTSAWALLSAPLRAPPHLPLITILPPAEWLHPVIPVCSDYIFSPTFWNKLRTELCSFPTFLPCFVTVLQEASRMLYLKQDS